MFEFLYRVVYTATAHFVDIRQMAPPYFQPRNGVVAELDQLLLKCISITKYKLLWLRRAKYKIQNIFLESN